MRVRLLTRVGCHLCDDAAEVLARVCAETGTGWDTVDVDSDDELRAAIGPGPLLVGGSTHAGGTYSLTRSRSFGMRLLLMGVTGGLGPMCFFTSGRFHHL